MATGHELESAWGLSLVNFDGDMCDPTESMSDFGGFGGFTGGDDIKEATEGVNLDGGCWMDAFDTMLV